MRHTIVLFVFKVRPTRRERLDAMIARWRQDQAAAAAELAFDRVDTLHFASVTVFERPLLDPLLVIECNADGELDDLIEDWTAQAAAGGGLGELLHCCGAEGSLPEALRGAVVRPIAEHVGAVGLSLREIRAADRIVRRARERLIGLEGASARAAEALRADPAIKAALAELGDLGPRRTSLEIAADVAGLAAPVGLAAAGLLLAGRRAPVATLGLLAIGGAALAAWIRRAEAREPVREFPVEPRDAIAAWENRHGVAQNHFASWAPLKTGPLRWLTLNLFMRLLARVAKVFHRQGALGGIPSIHFAHWAVVDGGSGLIFMSNFGGTWESYLDDFIEKAHVGLTGVWSHAQGFPRSRFILGDGATAEKAFKRYARDTQVEEAVWYVAYPHLTVSRINSNREVVDGLLGRAPSLAWLKRI